MPDVRATERIIDYANPLADQPIGSRALCERHADGGVTYTLPPEGVARALPGLIAVGVPAAAMLGLAILALTQIPGVGGCFLVMTLPFAALWAALLRSAKRPTVISVRRGRVTLISGAAVFSPVRSWPADGVTGVRVSVSGMSMRVRLTGDLKLKMRRRDAHLITGADKAELEWIARGMREALQLPAL